MTLPTQAELEAILGRLRNQQTESGTVDGKEDLPLETDGDRAFFIHHVAALANNVDLSYLIIGIEDQTWRSVGLAPASPLRNPDATQQRMNQILANRLDPNLQIRYSTYDMSGVLLGLVVVEGVRAPYITSIEDREFGGPRTRGKPSHIYRGTIYIRRGADSVAANRQSEVLGIAAKAKQLTFEAEKPDEFLVASNYLDISSPAFGHHPLTSHLVELQRGEASSDRFSLVAVPAKSWISFVFRPLSSTCTIDPVTLGPKLRPDQRIGRGRDWYLQIPRVLSEMLFRPSTTPKELLASLAHRDAEVDDELLVAFRIRSSGHVEFVATYPLLYVGDGYRAFAFVGLIGCFWQSIYLVKSIYLDAAYHGDTEILVSMIGTERTILADFAKSDGGWLEPFSPLYRMTLVKPEASADPNIQIRRSVALASATDPEIENTVRQVAQELGAYYHQDTPRCFELGTGTFPVQQYLRSFRW